ncbi:MAG: hypothetical protein M3Q23_18005 [Actinomycetota bacterium]|nr:hypothetical protein [Actinomycetota bacterium]
MAVTESGSATGHQVVLGEVNIDLREEARPDGYRPLAAGWARSIFFLVPPHPNWRYLLTAARCLDGAHRQFELLREDLERYTPSVARAMDLVNEAELAIMALHRALTMAQSVSTRVGISRPMPARIARRARGIKELRDSFAHIDERAAGMRRGRADPRDVMRLYRGGAALLDTRTVRFGRWSLCVDKPATDLMVEVRGYLRAAWHDLRRLQG